VTLRIERAFQFAQPVERTVCRLPHPVIPSMTVPYEALPVFSTVAVTAGHRHS
jgi:hypothetical protein